MVQVYNADLANSWGNLCSRAFNMTTKYLGGRVPDLWEKTTARLTQEMGNPLAELTDGLYERYARAMNAIDYSGAFAAVMELCDRANLYIEESTPWNLAKEAALEAERAEAADAGADADAGAATAAAADVPASAPEQAAPATAPTAADRLAFVLYNVLESIRVMALFFAPVMPSTSTEVFRRLGLGGVFEGDELRVATRWGGLPAGNEVIIGDPLFPRLKEDDL
jgi:methionyl-tRNA synthetase